MRPPIVASRSTSDRTPRFTAMRISAGDDGRCRARQKGGSTRQASRMASASAGTARSPDRSATRATAIHATDKDTRANVAGSSTAAVDFPPAERRDRTDIQQRDEGERPRECHHGGHGGERRAADSAREHNPMFSGATMKCRLPDSVVAEHERGNNGRDDGRGAVACAAAVTADQQQDRAKEPPRVPLAHAPTEWAARAAPPGRAADRRRRSGPHRPRTRHAVEISSQGSAPRLWSPATANPARTSASAVVTLAGRTSSR